MKTSPVLTSIGGAAYLQWHSFSPLIPLCCGLFSAPLSEWSAVGLKRMCSDIRVEDSAPAINQVIDKVKSRSPLRIQSSALCTALRMTVRVGHPVGSFPVEKGEVRSEMQRKFSNMGFIGEEADNLLVRSYCWLMLFRADLSFWLKRYILRNRIFKIKKFFFFQ